MTERQRRSRWHPLAGWALAIVGLILIPQLVPSYRTFVIALAFIQIIEVLSLNLLNGYTGQLSIAQASLMGIGAYTAVILSHHLKLPMLACILAAVAVSAAAGFLLGLPCVRLSGPYLAVATMAFALAVPEVFMRWEQLTGGYSGLAPQPASLFGIAMAEPNRFYYLVAIGLLLSLALLRHLIASHVGRAFIAVRDSEFAAQAMGIHLARHKVMAFTISAGLAGFGGALYGFLVGRVNPGDFSFWMSVFFLVAVVVGGEGSLVGSILGGLLITFVPYWTSSFTYLPNIILGLALIGVILAYPGGLAALAQRALSLASPSARRKADVPLPKGRVAHE